MSAPPASPSVLVVPLRPDTLRSRRSAGLFLGALLLIFTPIGAMVVAHAVAPAASAVVVAAGAALGVLVARAVWGPGRAIRLDGDELKVGRRTISLAGAFGCGFASASEPLPPEFARVLGRSGEPHPFAQVEIRAGARAVRFRPMMYEPGPMAQLVRVLTERAMAGDARAWLRARFPDAGAAPAARGRWVHPVVGIALFFVYALGVLVVLLVIFLATSRPPS